MVMVIDLSRKARIGHCYKFRTRYYMLMASIYATEWYTAIAWKIHTQG